ncbi:MAG: portal protein [Candidatus Omnitrophica bacterium]|nr:portal protein [Candidatus Omnitrophota bacterium]
MAVTDEQVRQILARMEHAKQQRSWWESTLWTPVIELLFPQMGSMLSGAELDAAEKRGANAYDGTPEWAADVLVAGMHNGLTPDNSKWFNWHLRPKELNDIPEVKKIREKRADITREYLQSSNYHEQTKQCYRQLAGLGTGIKWREKDPDKMFRFEVLKLSECALIENRRGMIDCLFRECKWTARNAYKAWGDKCSDAIKTAVKSESGSSIDQEYPFVMAVVPREDFGLARDVTLKDNQNMKYACLWIDQTAPDGQKVMEESGFNIFPASVPRWEKIPGDRSPYGRGPGIKALQDMGMLNELAKSNAMAAELMLFPSLAVPASGFDKTLKLTPRGQNRYTGADSNNGIYPINQVGSLPYSIDIQKAMREAVMDRFYVKAFLMLSDYEGSADRTQLEIMERKQEKLQILGPMLGTQKIEHLDADLDWCYEVLEQAGEFPDWPDEVYMFAEENITIEYVSPLFSALQLGEANAAIEVYQTAALISQARGGDPSVFDNLNDDRTLLLIAERKGAPMSILSSTAERTANRQARQRVQQEEAAIQQSLAAVQAAKEMGQISTSSEEPNALTDIVGAIQ